MKNEERDEKLRDSIFRTLFYGAIINFVIITFFMGAGKIQAVYFSIFLGSLLAGYMLNFVFVFLKKK